MTCLVRTDTKPSAIEFARIAEVRRRKPKVTKWGSRNKPGYKIDEKMLFNPGRITPF